MPTSMARKLSFNLSGIYPSAPITNKITFVLTLRIFRTSKLLLFLILLLLLLLLVLLLLLLFKWTVLS